MGKGDNRKKEGAKKPKSEKNKKTKGLGILTGRN